MPETLLPESSSAKTSFGFLLTFLFVFLITEDESERLCFDLEPHAAPAPCPFLPWPDCFTRHTAGFLQTRVLGVTRQPGGRQPLPLARCGLTGSSCSLATSSRFVNLGSSISLMNKRIKPGN